MNHNINNNILKKYIITNIVNKIKKFSDKIKNNKLQYFCENNNLKLVKLLVKYGANIKADNNFALRQASLYGHLDVIKYLVEHGADIEANNNGAVRWASEKGHLDVVKYLVEQGADIEVCDNYAVRYASENGHLEVVKYLVEQGADIKADNNYALIWAVWIFTRNDTLWSQQGDKLVGTGYTTSENLPEQGTNIKLSADGNTLAIVLSVEQTVIGGGVAWIFTRNGTTWSQKGGVLTSTGQSVTLYVISNASLSADGNMLAISRRQDNNDIGATWIFARNGTIWSQQGNKLVGTGYSEASDQGVSISLSVDGNTLAIGGSSDNNNIGATWIFT